MAVRLRGHQPRDEMLVAADARMVVAGLRAEGERDCGVWPESARGRRKRLGFRLALA